MASINDLLDLVNCTIRFSTPEGEYQGLLKEVFPNADTVIVGKLILLPDRRMGALNFRCSEMSNMKVINRLDHPNGKSKDNEDILPVYPKTVTEKLFDLDGSSDIEDDEGADNVQADYEMKLVRHLSKLVPRDFQIIDAFNNDFDLAIKHIRKQDAIGVSLEGIKISRSGTLTWLCISSSCCNFLFDILALGKQAFDKGLKFILENARIQKIFHDCRLASDCLYHKYNVRLVNVFDTQVADFIVMMQMVEKDKIDSRVNTLDACLNYYLEVPCDYLYGPTNFNNDKDSYNFHALRPLKHEIQDVLIKNVMYLHLLKRELELALMTPLRRATDVYLNSVQKLREKELLVVPHKPDELPPDIHLEGIQIFRYRDFEYLCSTAASGPPYREIHNPVQKYLNYCAEYKKGQRKDKESIVKMHASQSSPATSSEVNYKASVDCQKSSSGLKEIGYSSNSSSERDREPSDNLMQSVNHQAVNDKFQINNSENGGNTFVGYNDIGKSEGSQLNGHINVKNPIIHGLVELLAKYRNGGTTVKTSVDDSSRASKNVSAETISMKNESTIRDSSKTVELSNFKSACNPPCSDNMSKATTTQIHRPTTIGKKSPSELCKLTSGMRCANPLKAAGTCQENSTNGNIATSKSFSREGAAEINSVIPKAELLQINDSVKKKNADVSDPDLKDIEARVRARGALLRNCKTDCSKSDRVSMSDPVSRRVQDKLVKKTGAFSGNQECSSEEVTIYYSETLDKPSQFVVKVNHGHTRLADLYKKAGDSSLLWSEEGSENHSKSFCSQLDNYTDSDNIWAAIREDLPCKPIDNKLRSRLIPAGMCGY